MIEVYHPQNVQWPVHAYKQIYFAYISEDGEHVSTL